MKVYILLIAAIFSFLPAVSVSEERDHNEIVDVAEQDVEMDQAIKKARTTLPNFIKRFHSPKKEDANFALKVIVEDEFGVEHFWVTEIEIKNDTFVGYIANEPRRVKSVKNGQRVNFNKDIVTDWSYDHKNVRQGSYTLKVLLARMPKDQADYYRKQVGW